MSEETKQGGTIEPKGSNDSANSAKSVSTGTVISIQGEITNVSGDRTIFGKDKRFITVDDMVSGDEMVFSITRDQRTSFGLDRLMKIGALVSVKVAKHKKGDIYLDRAGKKQTYTEDYVEFISMNSLSKHRYNNHISVSNAKVLNDYQEIATALALTMRSNVNTAAFADME